MRSSGTGHRYGVVLVLVAALCTFALLAPDGPGARAAELAAAGACVLVAMRTSSATSIVGRRMAILLAAVLVVAVIGVAAGAPAEVIPLTATALAVVAAIAVILNGLVRLIVEQGVTLQAVFGALAVYFLVGLAFGFAIGAIATGFDGFYFAQGTDGTQSQRVYFSFTTLTTTGFGDLTSRTAAGRTLSVLEALLGQIYLVTVIGLLVGNLRGRVRQREDHPAG